MSTGAECRFEEAQPGRWSYWLQRWPYGDNPAGDTFGPFRSFAAAVADLQDNRANPGGWSVHPLAEGHVHEWAKGLAEIRVGLEVRVRVESLGPDATVVEAIRLVKDLPEASGAWRTHPVYGSVEVTRCEACGEIGS